MPDKNKPAKRTKAQAVPKQPKEIGIDLDKTLQSDILDAAQTSSLDLSDINDFNNIAQNRESIYSLIDTMAQDDTISSILETYAEDMVEPNDKGQIVWVESSDDYIAKYVQFLLDSLNVDKHIYSWAQSLVTYGDLYIKLFRESDVADDPVFQHRGDEPRSLNESSVEKQLAAVDDKPLKEDINLSLYHDNDHYIHYVEMVPNPSEMFELTKFGKTAGYIKASVASQHTYDSASIYSSYIKYKMKKSDITIYDATDFVHACLDSKLNRSPETVDIYFDDKSYEGGDAAKASSYTVKKGQSILSNAFRVWRELSLLENSVLLSRLTKSSIVRILNVDVGDMPKSQVKNFMSRLKAQIEQKSAINVGNSMQEYTNPGAIENVIYVPTHGTQGAITASSIGGDVDPKQLTDLDWFNNKLYGAFKVPKQYFGWCLAKDTKILLLDGTTHTIEELFNNKDKFIGKGIMACNADGSLKPTTITNVMLTNEHAKLLRVWLDNGKYVDVTPDHRMMLRNGEFVEAGDLKENDSLMPYYDRIEKGRRMVLDNKTGKWVYQYQLVSAEKNEPVEAGYNIHHLDGHKINDDFENLKKVTVAEHCLLHNRDLSQSHKEANDDRRKQNKDVNANVGSKVINNGVYSLMLKPGEKLPEGFEYGGLAKSDATKDKMRKARLRVLEEHPEYKSLGGFKAGQAKPSAIEAMKAGQKAYWDNMTEEEKLARGDLSRASLAKARSLITKHRKENMLKDKPEVVRLTRSLRCPNCGKIFEKKLNQIEYAKYLAENKLHFCSDECRKELDNGGKLARSYNLYKSIGPADYEQARNNSESRPDTYLKLGTLQSRLPKLESYVPEVNHRVVKIEPLGDDNVVYDLSVAADCHTFALPCGIFVHNCEDGAGFNGGTSLSIISSRYGKTVKRLQNTLCQMVTDIINLFLYDKHLDAYINKFTIRMQAPLTQEEIDRRDNKSNRIRYVSDVMSQLSDVSDPKLKLKILKAMLSSVVNDPEVLGYIQEQIDQLEAEESAGEDVGESEPTEPIEGPGPEPKPSVKPMDLGGSEPELKPEESEQGEAPVEPMEQPSGEAGNQPAEDSYLPNPSELGFDATANG